MNTTRYLSLGACAGILTALLLAQSGVPDANAQQAAEQDQTYQQPASTDVNTYRTDAKDDSARVAHHKMHDSIKASELIGMNVRAKSGDDNVGSINDLMIHKDGRVNYAAVSFGGFLGIGDKLFAVPLDAIEFVKTDNDSYARIDVTEETMKERKGFDQDHWPQVADRSFSQGGAIRQAERPVTDSSSDAVDLER